MSDSCFLSATAANLFSSQILGNGRKALTVGHGAKKIWMYSNYPEAIGRNKKGYALAESNYFLNRQTISGEGEVFFSHTNHTGAPLYCKIMFSNSSNTNATVTVSNYGYANGWDAGGAVTRFFNYSSRSVSVPKKTEVAFTTEYVSTGGGTPFTGMLHLNTSRAIDVTVYVCKEENQNKKFDFDSLVAFPYGFAYCDEDDDDGSILYPGVYSGYGEEFNLAFNHGTIKTTDFPYKYITNANDQYKNDGEIIPIHLIGEDKIAQVPSSISGLDNLANWCVHNYHTITFKNPSSHSVTICGYISGAHDGSTPVINLNGETKFTVLEEARGAFTWRWYRRTLSPNESFTLQYQHVLGSYGAGCQVTEWRLE